MNADNQTKQKGNESELEGSETKREGSYFSFLSMQMISPHRLLSLLFHFVIDEVFERENALFA